MTCGSRLNEVGERGQSVDGRVGEIRSLHSRVGCLIHSSQCSFEAVLHPQRATPVHKPHRLIDAPLHRGCGWGWAADGAWTRGWRTDGRTARTGSGRFVDGEGDREDYEDVHVWLF